MQTKTLGTIFAACLGLGSAGVFVIADAPLAKEIAYWLVLGSTAYFVGAVVWFLITRFFRRKEAAPSQPPITENVYGPKIGTLIRASGGSLVDLGRARFLFASTTEKKKTFRGSQEFQGKSRRKLRAALNNFIADLENFRNEKSYSRIHGLIGECLSKHQNGFLENEMTPLQHQGAKLAYEKQSFTQEEAKIVADFLRFIASRI